ncbi:MAG: LLM class F420-dependent oxidoreductase [Acidimicrobiia bacterium]|nr:LLM class F420-dependent oxidoreductase [Acidimicrobiia bacterium]
MRVSFQTRPQDSDWPSLVDFWKEGDRIEIYDAAWTFDHFYPTVGGGRVGGMSTKPGPVFEGWMMLGCMSGIVHRLRLGMLVSCATYRHPAVLANMAATLDIASDGRLEIGLGAGWAEAEHLAYGIPLSSWKERFDRLEETCAIVDSLLTNETTTFDGTYYRLRDARCDPKPIQRPRPPILIGGTGEKRTLKIAARWADQWNLPGGDPDVLRQRLEVLGEHCAAIGRDPAEIEVSVKLVADGDPGEFAELTARYRDAGAQHVIAQFIAPFQPAKLGALAERLQGLAG